MCLWTCSRINIHPSMFIEHCLLISKLTNFYYVFVVISLMIDWEPVVLKKKTLGTKKALGSASAASVMAAKIGGSVGTEQRAGAAKSNAAHLGKLEDSNDVFKHATVDKSLSKAIVQARLAKKMTQAQLATAINERPQIIQEYENGKAIPNAGVINKLDRALGCHLPRSKKK